MSKKSHEQHQKEQQERLAELGDNDEPVEEEIEATFDATVEEGAQRLQRTFPDMLITGFFGGLEVGLGVMAYLLVLHETGNHLLAGLAFSIGFIALLLAHSELFTENFLMPIAAVIAREASVKRLLMLWGGTLLANLAGGWLFMGLLTLAFPAWHTLLIDTAREFVEAPLSFETAALAILGGSTITLMTRMHQGTDSDVAKIIASVGAAFLLAGIPLYHSVLDSLLIFGAIQAGADFGYLDWLAWFWYTLLLNVLGGVLLVTALRLLRTKPLVEKRRAQAPEDPDEPHGDH